MQLVALIVGLFLVVLGGLGTRRRAGRTDEQRWRRLLLALLGVGLLLFALAPADS